MSTDESTSNVDADAEPEPEPSVVDDLHTDEWESEMQALLEDGDYDAELGLEMAKDAQRLVAGELDEADFYERYHEAVIDEFGVDDRPIAEAIEDADGDRDRFMKSLEELENGELDRREAMKKMGAAGLFLGLGTWATKENAEGGPDAASVAGDGEQGEGKQYGMVIDLEKCDGCLACVVACSQENNTSAGANWMYVFTYEDGHQEEENYLVRTCQHCSDAPCEKVCPTTARHKRTEDGLVLTDYDVCIGCRYCQVACPYGVNYFQWGEPDTPESELDYDHVYDGRDRRVDSRPPKGVMGKCTMCPSRQDGKMGEDKVGTTACEDACSMDAIHFGDMNDDESDPNQYLEQVREENPNDREDYPNRSGDTVSTFRLLEELGTDPNVVFVGNEPGPNAKQVEGPVKYEEIGEVDRRKEVLDDGTFAGGVSP
ncbi:4Fe-4S ferredoxin N-terminal domain-containing protein [Natronoglomus mannanivorans]|uniref:4Fe-4S dicluster domain-containing protein n=1 Tax=Natronoglomus mannanivorans TaxID=2979990 RepID=A0AAP2Z0Q3_9EURY|nr:4Fe-4S dicluster domain-containing protein [Halobacteria archaeon AArc-xg1-1]